jgi:putative FmdB family regulatory protein
MPLYEYECENCSHRFERIQKFSDPPVDKCPTCGGPVRKLLSSPAIQFKGSGWYITDYAKKSGGESRSTSSSTGSSSSDKKTEKSDSASTDKPAATTPTKTE